jgi:adenylate cyclase class 2
MSFEVEVKYRGVDHDQLVRQLAELGAEPQGRVDQEDSYMNHPARDFAVTNEAFRIRRIGDDNRQGGILNSREIGIGHGSGFQACGA